MKLLDILLGRKGYYCRKEFNIPVDNIVMLLHEIVIYLVDNGVNVYLYIDR